MNGRIKGRLARLAILLLILSMAGLGLRGAVVKARQREAENILFYYSDKILLQLQGTMNESDALARTASVMWHEGAERPDWFDQAARSLLDRPEVRMACLFEGDTLSAILPEDRFAGLEGRELRDFSYIYTMSKVVKELVVEGPTVLAIDPEQEEVFLFLQPIVEKGAYLGQVAVALDRDYVIKLLGLEDLYAQGYDYELWRVEPQNGSKEVVARSRPDVDFSRAQKTVFYLPTQWTLSIQPAAGWLTAGQRLGLILLCALFAALLLALAHLLRQSVRMGRELQKADCIDKDTGLYSRKGFTAALDEWLQAGGSPVMLFYFSIEGYAKAARLIGPDEEAAFLQSIPARIDAFIRSPYLAGRLDAGSYLIALREKMDGQKRDEFAKGLSLEFLLKARLDEEKNFLMARYQYACCEPGRNRAAAEIAALIRAYYSRLNQESPIRMLTEKCRQLLEGQGGVTFGEYTDFEMMELSKTFNRYRRQMEQLAYSDPVFGVGNRSKFFRDTQMLISYDKERRFSLYCVDIRAFSRYSELFGAGIGDEILQEALRRLSRPFGAYLYRINGNAFLGVSLSGESPASFSARLQRMFTEPVTVRRHSFPLRVRIAACLYPEHGGTPAALLDHIQSALLFAKEADRTIAVYNGQIDEMIRTEDDILRRLKDAIRRETLEVWYQPIMLLKDGRYTAAEALARLPDGKGGYFSARRVISLAERNGIVEELGDYVLRRACTFIKSRGDALGLKRVGVNLSAQQFWVRNSAGHLLEQIKSAGVDPRCVTLEIAESALIRSIDQAAEALKTLRQAGVHIALDDFGADHSSLSSLSDLPVDIIKIGRSLTQKIPASHKQYALLKSIVETATVNGLMVAAQGVETREEQEAVALSEADYIQGYYYARPMPEEVLDRFIGHRLQRIE